jgi:hypothetical protein
MTDYVSNSYLSKLNKCPAAAKVKDADSETFAFGRAFHSFTLEGEAAFLLEFVVAPEINKRTNAGKEEFEAFQAANAGKDVITKSEMELILAMSTAVHKHPFAKAILSGGKSEQTVIWTDPDTGINCKCRPDRIPNESSGVLVDLKSTSGAGEYEFGRSVVSYGYARQAAMYLDGVNAATGSNFDAFIFVAVEKTAPFRVETYLLDEDFIGFGRSDYKRLLQIELDCRARGSYPNRQSDNLITLYKPGYL